MVTMFVGSVIVFVVCLFFFFQAEDGIRDLVRSRGLGDVYKRQVQGRRRPPHAVLQQLPAAVLLPHDGRDGCGGVAPVSYTHLTLPTIYSV